MTRNAAGVRPLGVLILTLWLGSVAVAQYSRGAKAAPSEPAASMKLYSSPYYDVYSDLEPDRVKEAILRMTRMAEEYHERTKEFSGAIRAKFPFYLFRKAEDYYSAGAPQGSAGVFMWNGAQGKLMAIGGERSAGFTWHVIQHEGFHQFAHAVIGGDLPTWANEGLAEYFGEGLYTGDGFVTGLIPAARLKRIQSEIEGKKFKSIQGMMTLPHNAWNAEMSILNYDQAWSMVHFLAHGEGGKYQGAFAGFIKSINQRKPWAKAWEENFGSAEGFEKKWIDWWMAQTPDATRDLYTKAAAASLVSYLGRAALAKQSFDNFDEFLAAGNQQKLKMNDEDWLPPGLFQFASKLAGALKDDVKFELGKDPKTPQVIATMGDGTRALASFNLRTKTNRVTVDLDDLAPTMEKAKALIADKKKDEARKLLTESIRKHPKSPLVEEARKLAQQTFGK